MAHGEVSCDGLKAGLALASRTPPRTSLSEQLKSTAACLLSIRLAILDEDWEALEKSFAAAQNVEMHLSSSDEMRCVAHHLEDYRAKQSMGSSLTTGAAGKGEGLATATYRASTRLQL